MVVFLLVDNNFFIFICLDDVIINIDGNDCDVMVSLVFL